jgi:hypothetical protein
MNKTVSLIVRILSILAAIGAGVLWYVINQYNIEHAMNQTKWLDNSSGIKALGATVTDNSANAANPQIKAAVAPEEFIGAKAVTAGNKEASVLKKRMDSLSSPDETKGVPHLIRELSKKIDELFTAKQNLDATLTARDNTIKDRDNTITGLETDKANLTREKNKLTEDLNTAKGVISTLEGDKAALQSEIAAKNATIAAMFTKEQYQAEQNARKTAEDLLDRAMRTYSRLRNWGTRETGVTPPYPVNPTLTAVNDNIPKPKQDTPRILTSIAAVDYRKGLLTLFLGKEEKENALRTRQIYDVEVEHNIIGRIRVNEVLDGMTVATILPQTNQRFLVKNARLNLIRSQAKSEDEQVIGNATAPIAPAGPAAAPATPAPAPEAPAPVSPFAPGSGGAAPTALPEI